MTILEWMDTNWFSAAWVILFSYLAIAGALNLISTLHNRFWRHWNIRKHGWPPIHCDADGDLRPLPKDKDPIDVKEEKS